MDEEEKMQIEDNIDNSREYQKKLCNELTNFLKLHSVYETIPENMKVKKQ
jgi:hypothetical protein